VLLNPWVIAAFAAAFGVALTWILILNKYELSWAYPFMSLTFPLVVFASAVLFQEQLSWLKVIGVSLIVVGVALQAMG
jgi:multidrug transporter EmrE-like cation transporter